MRECSSITREMSNLTPLFLCKVQLSVLIIHGHSKYYLNYVKLHLYGIPASENGFLYVLIGKFARLISQIDFAISSFRHQNSSFSAAYTFLISSLDQPIALTGFQIGRNVFVFVIKVFNLLLSVRGKNCALSFVTALEYSKVAVATNLLVKIRQVDSVLDNIYNTEMQAL